MKKYMMMAALAAATVGLFTSCSEEEIVKVSAQAGEPIRFAATARVAGTRTVYGDKVDNQWPLYWVDGDQVMVNCPQAQASEEDGKQNTATYTVSDADGTNVYSVQGEGLYWGAEDTHNFYEAYPAANVQEIKDGVLTATMPETQTPTLVNGYYVDMNAALMAGATSCQRSSLSAGGVELPFEPIFTAVDITISASPNQDFELKSITVANISTDANPAPVAGSFTYNYATKKYTTVVVKNNVQMEFDTPITLAQGSTETVKATIFIRGDYNKAVKVQLNGKLDDQLTLLAKEGDPEVAVHLLKPSMRNHIVLGALPEKQQDTPPVGDLTGANWIAFEKNSTPVSKMSLPGSYDSGNFVEATSGKDRTQTKSFPGWLEKYAAEYGMPINTSTQRRRVLEKIPGNDVVNYQLDHGVRVFDMRLKWDNSAAQRGFFTNKHDNDASGNATILRTFITDAVKWLKAHTTEFLVVFLTDDADAANFKAHIYDEITNKIMVGEYKDYYLMNFDPNITVAQARGKILFVESNYTGSIVGNNISAWSKESVDLQTSPFLIGTGNAFIHDHFTVAVADKENQIKSAFAEAKKETVASNWHITGTCFHTRSSDNISDRMRSINTLVINQVAQAAKEKKQVGIVLLGYVCTDENNQRGQKTVDDVWNLNFVE